MPDVPAVLPTSLISGNTWQWDRAYGDYPAPTWTATAYFENKSKTFSVVATAEGTAHRFTISAATSADYPAGRYKVSVRVTDGSQVFIAEAGYCDVQADPAAAGMHDTRTWAKRTLDELEALLERFATTAQQSGSVGGRTWSRADLPMLTQWRKDLRQEVRTEEQAGRSGSGRYIKVRPARV